MYQLADTKFDFGLKPQKQASALLKSKIYSMQKEHLKKYRHAPTHLFLTDYYYFVTAGTYRKSPYFDADDRKELLLNTICEMLKDKKCELQGWVILNNHYHILMKLEDAFLLPEIVRKIHSKSAVLLNKQSNKPRRKIWYQYWDECIRDEKDFYAKLNYIHLNPVKHGYVDEPGAYKFSSYVSYLKIEGRDWLKDLLKRYPAGEILKTDEF